MVPYPTMVEQGEIRPLQTFNDLVRLATNRFRAITTIPNSQEPNSLLFAAEGVLEQELRETGLMPSKIYKKYLSSQQIPPNAVSMAMATIASERNMLNSARIAVNKPPLKGGIRYKELLRFAIYEQMISLDSSLEGEDRARHDAWDPQSSESET